MSLYRSKKSPYWQYDFVIKGSRLHGSTGTADRRTATLIEAKIRTEAAEGAALKQRRRMTLDEAAGRYFEEVAVHQTSSKTTDYQLANLVERLGRATLLNEIDGNRLTTYIARRRAEVADASVNREIQLLRRVLHRADGLWNIDVGRMPRWRSLLLPEPDGRVRELGTDEERRLFKHLRSDFHPLVRFCLATGIRLMNAITLTWPQVDFENAVIRLKVKSRKPGGDVHTVPMTPGIRVLLSRERDHHRMVVFTYQCAKSRGQRRKGERYPFTKTGWRRAWRAALKSAGIDDFRFHDTRHTAGTRTMRASKNLKVVQAMLGHKNITTTARYAHVNDDDVRDAMLAVESRNIPELVSDLDAKALKEQA